MAVFRDRPYVQFNFLVDLGAGSGTDSPDAGFQEVSGIGMEVTVAEYRNGNEKENSVRKITGLNKSTDVTLKRGIIGSLNLYQWLEIASSALATMDARRLLIGPAEALRPEAPPIQQGRQGRPL